LTINGHDKCHLPWSFNKDNYDVIEAFKKKHIINVPLHLKGLQIEDDRNYITISLIPKTNMQILHNNIHPHKRLLVRIS
jgi:hypothetical protein